MVHFATIFAAQVDYVATLRVLRTHFKSVEVEGHEMRWTKLHCVSEHGRTTITATDHHHAVDMIHRIDRAQKDIEHMSGTVQASHRVQEQLRHCQWVLDFACDTGPDGAKPWETVHAVARRPHSVIVTREKVTDARDTVLLSARKATV